MLITNTSKSTRGFHDKFGKPVMLAPGEERNVDIDAGTQALLKRMGDVRLGGGSDVEQKPEHVSYVREETVSPRRGRPRRGEG